MKDLKANIQKNNIKKLVLSAVLSMFCYCTNNAMKNKVKTNEYINDVLIYMFLGQQNILVSKETINKHKKSIYFKIKEEDGTVKKGRVLEFIKNRFTNKEQEQEGFDDDIKKIEQYFHLEEIKNDNDECNEGNLTEIFWSKEGEVGEIEKEDENDIKTYFDTIINAEKQTNEAFKKYYKMKKTKNQETQDEEILKEIMKDCCGNEKKGYDIVTNFLLNLGKLCKKNNIKNNEGKTFAAIKRRITLSSNTAKEEEDFISFLKQKIGIEEKKEEEKKNEEQKNEPKKEKEGCPCCNCQKNRLKKKENPKGDLGRKSKEKKLEGEGGAQESDKSIK